jgi:hypothetical protein
MSKAPRRRITMTAKIRSSTGRLVSGLAVVLWYSQLGQIEG